MVGLLVNCLFASEAFAQYEFGVPQNLGSTFNSDSLDGSMTLTADGLSMFFDTNQSGSLGSLDIFESKRQSINDPWGKPVSLGDAINSSSFDGEPSISSDGLSLFFASDRSGGSGAIDIWITTRTTVNDPWTPPVNLGSTFNSAKSDANPCISNDGLSLYFSSGWQDVPREGGFGKSDLWVATRDTLNDPWKAVENLGQIVNTNNIEGNPQITKNGLCLFFTSDRPGGFGGLDLWMTQRLSLNDPWQTPENLGPNMNTSYHDAAPGISHDGALLFFTSDRPHGSGGFDIWQASFKLAASLTKNWMLNK